MYQALHQLGIDWKLLASQGANFLVLLVALTFLVYRPLIKVLNDRRKKIELGLQSAAEAEKRLRSIDDLKEAAAREAKAAALAVVNKAEATAKVEATDIITKAKAQSENIINQATIVCQQQEALEMAMLKKESGTLISQAIAKAVGLKPDQVDQALVEQAAVMLSKSLS